MKKYNELGRELGLIDNVNKQNLHALIQWCEEHISRDIEYKGKPAEQFARYKKLAQTYLDHFLALEETDFYKPISSLDNMTVIQFAAKNGYERFLSAQTNIPESALNVKDTHEMTPLHWSATLGYFNTVRVLLEHGANPLIPNAFKQLPLHRALFVPIVHNDKLLTAKENIFRLLLTGQSSSLGAQELDGNTVLHHLAVHNFVNLIADVIKINPKLAFIANNALMYPSNTAILNNQFEALDILLNVPGVADLKDVHKRVALHFAAMYGKSEKLIVRTIKATQDINVRDAEHKTPLHRAAEASNQLALETLIKSKADLQATDHEGSTILHIAVKKQDVVLVKWILEHAPMLINIKDKAGYLALDYTTGLDLAKQSSLNI